MKKLISVCILGLASMHAMAENWQPVGSSDQAELLMDVDSIKDVKNIRQAWSLWNFKEARDNNGDKSFPTLKSYQNLHEYNCKDKTLRLTREIIFAENNAQGAKRDHSDALKNMQFNTPAEGSIGSIMIKLVCEYDNSQTAAKP